MPSQRKLFLTLARSVSWLLVGLVLSSVVVQVGLGQQVGTEENQGVGSASAQISGLLRQLEAPSFSERKQAFLGLVNAPKEWELELRRQCESSAVMSGSVGEWFNVLRSLPASRSMREQLAKDYVALSKGDPMSFLRYTSKVDMSTFLVLLKLLPAERRETLWNTLFVQGFLDQMLYREWVAGGNEHFPQMLEVLVPKSPLRLGLNHLWKSIGMPANWKLTLPTVAEQTSDYRMLELVLDGKVSEAIALADKDSASPLSELLRIRFARWEEWIGMDPVSLRSISPVWSDVPKAILLESLDRHEEADAYYGVRKLSVGRSSGDSKQTQRIATALLALVVGDQEALDDALRENAPRAWRDMLFLQNRVDELLELEGLQKRDPQVVGAWISKNLSESVRSEKCVRFMALFHRLGDVESEQQIREAVMQDIEKYRAEDRLAQWRDYLKNLQQYGLDELRAETMVRALKDWRWDIDEERGQSNSVPGFPQAIARAEVSLQNVFEKAYPFIPNSGLLVFRALSARYPELTLRERLDLMEGIHAGRDLKGISVEELVVLFRTVIAESRSGDFGAAVSEMTLDMVGRAETTAAKVACELASTFVVMGHLSHAVDLLEAFPQSMIATLDRAFLLKDLGRFSEAKALALECLQRNQQGDWAVHMRVSRLFRELQEQQYSSVLKKLPLCQLEGLDKFDSYSRRMPLVLRAEMEPEVEYFLQHQWDTCSFLWVERLTAASLFAWNTLVLANQYHKVSARDSQKVPLAVELQRASCLFELSSTLDGNFFLGGGDSKTLSWELDWSRLSAIFERTVAMAFWQAILDGDQERADRLLRTAYRYNPEQINTLIDAVPWIRERFPESTLRKWFDVYYVPMMEHLERYPEDLLVGNNAAWLAAKCGFEFDAAHRLATKVTQREASDTYLDTLAEVEFVRGNRERAMEISMECKKLNPRDPHHGRQIKRYFESVPFSKP
jgi:tetratricopeptide (TPR) repeat protein